MSFSIPSPCTRWKESVQICSGGSHTCTAAQPHARHGCIFVHQMLPELVSASHGEEEDSSGWFCMIFCWFNFYECSLFFWESGSFLGCFLSSWWFHRYKGISGRHRTHKSSVNALCRDVGWLQREAADSIFLRISSSLHRLIEKMSSNMLEDDTGVVLRVYSVALVN